MNTSGLTLHEIYEMPKFSSVRDILSPHAEFVKTLMHMVNLSGFKDTQNSGKKKKKNLLFARTLILLLYDIVQQRFSC